MSHSRSTAVVLALTAATLMACGKARTAQSSEVTGLRLELLEAAVNANRQVEATYRVTDGTGRTRNLSGITNSWTLASLSQDAAGVPMYVAYVRTGQQMPNGEKQPGSETENSSSGSQDLGDGKFRYTFRQQLPEGYDAAATYRVGVYSRVQTGTDASGAAQFDPEQPNAVLDFVPAGGTPQSRELVADGSCNVCHTEVRAHGGFRRGVKICTTCHTTQLYDPDTPDPAKLQLGEPNAVLSTVSDGGGTALPANPLDLGRLVHRIHRGRQLQTVQNTLNAARGCPDPTTTVGCPATPPALSAQQDAIAAAEAAGVARYHVIGFQNSDNVFGAAKVRTENGVSTVYASGVNLPPPNDVRNCTACHDSTLAKDAGQHLETVERRICTACHADVWFNGPTPPDKYHVLHVTPFGPLQFPIISDTACAGCHAQHNAPPVDAAHPLSSLEFGRYVDYAHTVPFQSKQLRGLKAEVLSMTGGPGQTPTITFKLSDADGPINSMADFTPLPSGARACTDAGGGARFRGGTLRATVNGPTSPDYVYWSNYFQEVLHTNSTLVDSTNGTWTHTFTRALPQNATGTWAVSFDVRRDRCLVNPDEPPSGLPAPPFASPTDPTFQVTEGAVQNVFYWNVQGGAPVPRKLAVANEKCSACHLQLQFHGNQRDNVEYCAMCHAPDLTDFAQRPKVSGSNPATVDVSKTVDAKEERSVHLKVMIHRIHMGSGLELQKPFAIYGFGGTPAFFDEGGLPEPSRARCDKCHDDDAYKLEAMPAGRLPTIANETATPVHAGTAVPVAGERSIRPMTAACISCHDTQQAVDHVAGFQGGSEGERCLECHGDRGVRAVSHVHPINGQPPTQGSGAGG